MKLNRSWQKEPLWEASGEGAPSPDAAVTPEPPAGPDLSFVPETFHVDGKPDLGKFAEHYGALTAAEAARAEAAKSIPEAYEFALPTDLKFEGMDLPEGFTFEMKPDDPVFQPLLAELGGMLKEMGAPADAAPKAAAMIAKYEAAKYSKDYAAAKAEMAILGTPAQAEARLSTVQRLLDARLPKDQAEAVRGLATSAKALMAIETLLHPGGTQPLSVTAAPSVETDLKNYYANPKR